MNDLSPPQAQDRDDRCPGTTYTVTVADVNGCTAQLPVFIDTKASDLIIALTPNDASCNSTDGKILLSVNGGAAPYTYLWNNSATTQDCVGLSAGEYTVTVTDAGGCTKTGSAVVGQIALLDLNVSTRRGEETLTLLDCSRRSFH